MQTLDRTQNWKLPFIPDRGTSAALNADAITLDFGRIVIEKHASGQMRMKVGRDGTKTFANEVYLNDNIITRADATTKAFGDIPAGTVLTDKSVREAFNDAYWAYQNVVLSNLYTSPSKLEIGFELSGNLLITSTISNSDNLALGDAATIDSTLVANGAFDPRLPLTIAAIATTKNIPTDEPITVELTGLESETSQKSINFQWLPRILHLVDTSEDMTTEATILAAAGGGSILSNSRTRDYDFDGGGYSHIYIPSFISIANIGFTDIDVNTGLPLFNYAMQQQSDVVINNGQISVTLQYFRSVNQFTAATRFRVS